MTEPIEEQNQTLTDDNDTPEEGTQGSLIVDEATDSVLRLHLDKFEGPFEVLLYLIKSQEIDIFDIPIVKITEQYLRFLELLQDRNLEVTGDFLVMAATLIQIKSRMLLPIEVDDEEDDLEEEDPRLELVEKLIEYRRYGDVMERLRDLERERERWFTRNTKPKFEPISNDDEYIEASLYDLMQAFRGVIRFFSDDLFHEVELDEFTVDDKIGYIEDCLSSKKSLAWTDLFRECKSKVELITCFLAILELCRMGRISAHQHRLYDDIRLFPKERNEIAEPVGAATDGVGTE